MSANPAQSTETPVGFCYVPQDHYYLANLTQPVDEVQYLYSDGATSCIIVIVLGTNSQNEPIVLLGHLSKPETFETFFTLVDASFRGEAQVFAQGANNVPLASVKVDEKPHMQTNIDLLNNWVNMHTLPAKAWQITTQQLWLNTGHPLEQNRDCLGVDLTTLSVSNDSFVLNDIQRDPSGGLQTLVSLFGTELQPPINLRLAHQPFSHSQIKQLLYLSLQYQWLDILVMDDDEILYNFSSTPHCEVAWFCEAFRQSAQYVKSNLYLILS